MKMLFENIHKILSPTMDAKVRARKIGFEGIFNLRRIFGVQGHAVVNDQR